jgi:hypothetical protein
MRSRLYYNFFIFGWILLIFGLSLKAGYEPFDASSVYICAGDSILNNEPYVSKDNSVISNLARHINIHSVARDHARISDIVPQLAYVSISTNTSVILSVGGNDLLDMTDDVYTIYNKYTNLVSFILQRYVSGSGKLYLVNLYYPPDKSIQPLHPLVSIWNSLLNDLSTHTHIQVIDISHTMTSTKDFTNAIEPSDLGGPKVAATILEAL